MDFLSLPGLIGLSALAWWWSRALTQARGEPSGWLRLAPWMAAAIPLLSCAGVLTGLWRTFDALSHASPDDKQALLAQGIAESMYTLVAGFAAVLVLLAALGVTAWGQRTRVGH